MPEVLIGRIGDEGAGRCTRVLVDRLWPRGVRRETAPFDCWYPKVAPSTELRQWLHAHRDRYPEFCVRYQAELEATEPRAALDAIRTICAEGPVILLTAARSWQEGHLPVIRDAILSGLDGKR